MASKRTNKEIMDHLKAAMDAGEWEIRTAKNGTHREYVNVLDESQVIPLTTVAEVASAYERMVLDANVASLPGASSDPFANLPRVSMFVGQPDTGKTFKAIQIAKDCGVEPLIKMCRDNLNLETLLEDFIVVDGKPQFSESVALKMMSDPNNERAIIVFDEFNTLLTGVMKTLQPIFDDTSTTFEYRGKIYHKNLNCKFVVTLNDKDKGISIVPDAILSRSRLTWFEPVTPATISKWTGVSLAWIQQLQDVYKALGLLSVFGTRQIKMLNNAPSVEAIKNHLYGLCQMRNIDGKSLDTLEVQQLINKLV